MGHERRRHARGSVLPERPSIARVEARFENNAPKNRICPPLALPNSCEDWLPMTLGKLKVQNQWAEDSSSSAMGVRAQANGIESALQANGQATRSRGARLFGTVCNPPRHRKPRAAQGVVTPIHRSGPSPDHRLSVEHRFGCNASDRSTAADHTPMAKVCLTLCALQSGYSGFVKSFGRRLAYESPRGTNPRCVVRSLWGFEELRVLRVTGVVLPRLPRTADPAVLPPYQGTGATPRLGKVGDDVWDRRD